MRGGEGEGCEGGIVWCVGGRELCDMWEGGVGWWEVWEGAGHENHEMREWGGENWEGLGGYKQ